MEKVKRVTTSVTFNLSVPSELEIYNTLNSFSEKSFNNKSQIIKKALDKYFKEFFKDEKN